MVSEMGLEPTRKIHTHLKRTCLPFHHSDVVSILLFTCQFCIRLRGGCCSLEQPSRKNDTQSFFSAEYHSDVVSILLFTCQFCARLRGGCCSFEQPSRKTIHYVISWSLALNGSAVICFINCIYSANKPSPSARSRSAEYHSDVVSIYILLSTSYSLTINTASPASPMCNPRIM